MEENTHREARIKIVGVGGAGGNAVRDMQEKGIAGVEYIVINTDSQDLDDNNANVKIRIGETGLGAGQLPEFAKKAAESKREQIKETINGTDMLFITAGMGGGTGTGAAPVVAKIAKDMDILTIGIVTKPFMFEGRDRIRIAEEGLLELAKHVDSLIVIPNDKLVDLEGESESLIDTWQNGNSVLRAGIQTIAELITKKGYINLDFADIKTIMADSGIAIFGYGVSTGDEDILQAVDKAIRNPIIERDITGANKMLVNITLDPTKKGLKDIRKIMEYIHEQVNNSDNLNIIQGIVYDRDMDGIRISIVATDFNGDETRRHREPKETLFEQENRGEESTPVPVFDI